MPSPAVDFHLRPLRAQDIPHTDVIRALAGWNQTTADWRRLLALAPAGCFVAEVDGLPVGSVTTTAYGRELAWIGMMLVHPEQRSRGIGRGLLDRAIGHLEQTGVGCIGLDATPAGQPLYASAGFASVWELARWRGNLPLALPPPSVSVQTAIDPTDWPALVELDRRSFGAARPDLLRALHRQSSRAAVLTDAAGEASGFGMLRAGSLGHMLGPLLATEAPDAAALLAALSAHLPPGPIFWDIPEPNTAAVALAESLGFSRVRTLTRMVRGAPFPPHEPGLLYAVADLAAG